MEEFNFLSLGAEIGAVSGQGDTNAAAWRARQPPCKLCCCPFGLSALLLHSLVLLPAMDALLAALAVPGPPQKLILGHLSLQER